MTTGVALPDAPPAIVGRRLFAVQDIEFTVADVARHARRGDRDRVPAPTGAAGPAAVQESFRRARGLLTSDQLESWLDDWAISPEAFLAWSEAPAADSWVAYLCSGRLDDDSARIAAAAAAACALGEPPASAGEFDPTGWIERLAEHAVTGEAVRAALTRHRLDWTTLHGLGVVAPSRAVAEELRHWVVADGLDLGIAATQAGCPTYRVGGRLEELEPAPLRAQVSGARRGELVGPVAAGSGWTVLRVDDRTEPASDDPACLARARAAVAADVVERAVLRHVTA